MTRLLVSVRSATEAEAALGGGAALIDVKEPAHGSLGRASDDVIADVVRVVAGQRPISAALGEWADALFNPLPPSGLPLTFVKWGLAGSQAMKGAWRPELAITMKQVDEQLPNCRAVTVSYADWRRAGAPRPQEVCSFAIKHAAGAFLIDTWQKDGTTLLDWLSLQEIQQLQERCRIANVPVALAGSLGLEEIHTLLPLRPDWIAVRGAVCLGQKRSAAVAEEKVRQLAELVGSTE